MIYTLAPEMGQPVGNAQLPVPDIMGRSIGLSFPWNARIGTKVLVSGVAYFLPAKGEQHGRAMTSSRWIGAAGGLVGGQVVGWALSTFLSTRTGERFLNAIDPRPLTPLESQVLAKRWAGTIGKAISAAVALLFLARSGEPGRGGADQLGTVREHTIMSGPTTREIDWIQVMQRVAEVLLALGAIFKVFGQYLEDRQRTALESERAAAKRLA
jgi:hypothetical protein